MAEQYKNKIQKGKAWTKEIAKAWKKYKPPIRPSKELLGMIESYIDKKMKEKGTKTKVLILGSTPEFRDLALKKGLIPTVVDYSADNYHALGLLRTLKKGEEIFIKQDWRDLNLQEKFDIVLAEGSLTVLAKKDVSLFLEKIKNVLAQNGYFLAKTWVRLSKQKERLDKVLKNYRENHKGENFCSIAVVPLYYYFYNEKKNSLALKYLWIELKKMYQKGILRKKELESIAILGYEDVPLKLYFPLKSEIVKTMRKYFKVEAIKPSGFYNSQYFPVFVLRPLDR